MTIPDFLYTRLINQSKPIMNSLRLSPLPSIRPSDESSSRTMEKQGFVDEAVVMALLTDNHSGRSVAYPEDLALAADDLDFAGWQLPATQAARPRAAEIPPHVINAIVRRASPPLIAECGIGTPHQGNHRWWLAGLAGVLSTMLFTLLLLTLSSRPGASSGPLPPPAAATDSQPMLSRQAEAIQASPELTAATFDLPWHSAAEWTASDD